MINQRLAVSNSHPNVVLLELRVSSEYKKWTKYKQDVPPTRLVLNPVAQCEYLVRVQSVALCI